MANLSAEILYRKGLAALGKNDLVEATNLFRSATLIERERGAVRPRMRYVSYFGLALAQQRGPIPEAVQACERAARYDCWDPELQLNLARVYLMSGRTRRALMALERGRQLDPTHQTLRAELAKVDRRAKPVIPWLSRNNALNVSLGKVRASMSRRLPFKFKVLPRREVTPS